MYFQMDTGVSLSRMAIVAFMCTICLISFTDAVFLPLPTEIGSDFEFDLQLTVPYTIVLPPWVGRRKKRQSLSSQLSSAEERVMAAYNMHNVEGVIASRLESIFSHLGIYESSCQRRLLCLLTQYPDKYTPLSDIILQHLIPLHSQLLRADVNSSSAMWRYVELYDAGKKGFSLSTNCTHETIACSKHPDHGIDWNILNAWQTFMRFVKIRFN